jgi:hypothetical protein
MGPEAQERNERPSMASFLLVVFQEVNAHLRSCEEKMLVSLGFFVALLGVVASIVGPRLTERRASALILSGLLLGIGTVVFGTMRSFRVWKNHYTWVCKRLRDLVLLSNEALEALPLYLYRRDNERGIGSDTMLLVAIVLANLSVLAYVLYQLWAKWGRSITIRSWGTAVSAFAYVVVLIVVNGLSHTVPDHLANPND